jgi:5'-phosphate synthase pdxT subunit
MKIGVLALQGSFLEHQTILKSLGVDVAQVRKPEQLESLNGLIMPGGESTTFTRLAEAYQLIEPLKNFAQQHAMWGTCAGAIFMAKDIHRRQPTLGLMDITIERNAFGRQLDSFEVDLSIPVLNGRNQDSKPFHAVFIRAPLIKSVSGSAVSLAELPDGRIVAARQGHLLATAFHPELTSDDRFHRYFLDIVSQQKI